MDVIDEHSDARGTRLAMFVRPLTDENLSVVFYGSTTVEVTGNAVVRDGNIARAKTLLPMIKSLLARYPLKRVVRVANRGLLTVDNLDERAKLQATLAAEGRAVSLEYVLAVPAARYGDSARRLAR